MMKLILLVALCAFGFVSCETHNQQIGFSDRLIEDIGDAAEDVKELLKRYDQNTEDGKYLILLNANSVILNAHLVLDSLQYYIVTSEEQSMALQNIVSKLNSITYELQKSFKNGIGAVKSQLQTSIENIVVEAKNLRQIIRENGNHSYRSMALRFLDDLVNVVQEVVSRDTIQGNSKDVVKSLIRIAKKILTTTLSTINSTNGNVRKDMVRYSSKLSSAISGMITGLKDFGFSFQRSKDAEVKEIIYTLGKIVEENEEVLYMNENSLQKVKDQFHVTLVNLTEQLNKIVDASYSGNGNIEDTNLMYSVLPFIMTQANQLQRNFEKTINNYVRPRSDEY